MRITETKIRQLAAGLAGELGGRPDVLWIAAPAAVEAEIARIIRDNLEEEDALDRDVDRMMERYRREIASGHLDVDFLRQKIKKQLAKERGLVF